MFTSFGDLPAVETSNRYFTPKVDANAGDAQELTQEVDPDGQLARAAGSSFVHTGENKVHYYEKREDQNKNGYL